MPKKAGMEAWKKNVVRNILRRKNANTIFLRRSTDRTIIF